MSDERITEAEIAELERELVHADDRGVRMLHWAPAHNTSGCWCGKFAKLLSERREREGKLAEADAGWTDAETRCAMEGAQRHHAEEKLAEAEQRATNWEDDAQRYAQNSDYWKKRAEAAEATLVRVRELAKEYEGSHCLEDDFLPRLREALTAPVVSSDHCTGIKIDDGELGPMCSQPGCDEFHQERPPTRVHCERCPDRLAPSVSHQEDK